MTDKPKDKDKAKEEEPEHFLKYNGTATRRVLTLANLDTLGVNADRDLVWDQSNKKSISTKGLNKSTVEAVAKLPGFELV